MKDKKVNTVVIASQLKEGDMIKQDHSSAPQMVYSIFGGYITTFRYCPYGLTTIWGYLEPTQKVILLNN